MTANVGGIDRRIRFLVGSILILVALFAPVDPVWRIIILILAVIALVTAIVRF